MTRISPLIADGPLKGQTYSVDTATLYLGVRTMDAFYIAHRFPIAPLRYLVILSVQSNPTNLPWADLIDEMLSDRAKEALQVQ